MIRVHDVSIDIDEQGFELVLDTDSGEFRVNIQMVALKLHDLVRREIGPYAAEAEQARADIATGTFSVRAEILELITDQDSGYALDDPKHPTYYERMVD